LRTLGCFFPGVDGVSFGIRLDGTFFPYGEYLLSRFMGL
jgi:hypothetical protein